MIDVAVSDTRRPHEVEYVFNALQVHREAFEPVGDFTRNRLAIDPADLLKISELCDFHAVQPHFPAETPRPERRILPIVFHKPDVVRLRIDADRDERPDIKIEDVERRRLEHDLELIIVLQTVWI